MRPHYLLIAFDAQEGWQVLVADLAQRTGLSVAWSQASLAALVNSDCHCFPLGEHGVIVGTLFHRHGSARRIERLEAAEVDRVLQGGSDHLLHAFWGGYVAALPGERGVRVLRDPSAALPCYNAAGEGLVAFASNVETLLQAGLEMPNKSMKAVSGHSKDDEVARYTEAADQERLAERAITRLAEWEMSNLESGLDTKSA